MKRDSNILILAIIAVSTVFAIALLMPEQVIIDFTSGAVELMVIGLLAFAFKTAFFIDKSGRIRIQSRSNPYGSVWTNQTSVCLGTITFVCMFLAYHFLVHPSIVHAISSYVYELGGLYGAFITVGALLFLLLMGMQMFGIFKPKTLR